MKSNQGASNKRKSVDEENQRERLKEYLSRLIQLGVNLRQDWFFRIVFGRSESKPLICGLMNGVLRNANEPTVKSIKIKNPFTFGQYYGDKNIVVDVAVEDESGNQYDVEMQTWNHANFRERTIYYLEKIAAKQLKKGDSYDQLHKVIGIVFVDFPIWSESNLNEIKNLTPELAKKLKKTQFETIKLMSVDNGVVFSDCLTLYFVRIPEAGESFSSGLHDQELIDWLKAFRFPESTSEDEMLQIETNTPEIKELRKQMFELLATPKRRAYIEGRQRFLSDRNTMLKENADVKKENAAVKKENAVLTTRLETLEGTLVRERQEQNKKDVDRQRKFCQRLIRMAANRFDKPVSEIEKLLEGQTQETLDEAFDLLLSNVDYNEFAQSVSKVH